MVRGCDHMMVEINEHRYRQIVTALRLSVEVGESEIKSIKSQDIKQKLGFEVRQTEIALAHMMESCEEKGWRV
jgi:hypothetical protein